MERERAVLESLRRIVTLAQADPEDNCVNGLVAYEAWIADLENPPAEPNLHANAYSYAILLTSRAAGVVYLARVAEGLQSGASLPLRGAAARYRTVSERLLAGKDCLKRPWDKSWTPENRAQQAELLRQCLADEQTAVGQIQEAVGELASGQA